MSDDHRTAAASPPIDFIRAIVDEDLASGKHHGRVATRFPPEPNGYLHIGHAKSICLNFGIAEERGGICNLRFDDTNPTKEDVEYVDAIREDVEWLGFKWDAELYASDYFEQLYQFAVTLIKQGKAYVDSLNADEVRALPRHADRAGTEQSVPRSIRRGESGALRPDARGRIPGRRARPAREDRHGVAQFQHARSDAVPDSSCRRIIGPADAWCIYPMYDYAHPLSDAIERITHSICTLEYEDHRPLYDWLVDHLIEGDKPHQYRVRAAEPELHGDEQAQAAAARAAEASSRAGTIRGCRRSAAFAAAATRRKRSAISAPASASRRRKTSSTSRSSSTACARTSIAARRA